MPEKKTSADQADTENVDETVDEVEQGEDSADEAPEVEAKPASKAAAVDDAIAEANRRAARKDAEEAARAEKAAAKAKAKAEKQAAKAKSAKAKPGKPAKSKKQQKKKPGTRSRGWVAPLMLACWLLGLAWLVVYYIAGRDVPYMQDLGNWNLIIGMGLIAVGFIVSTQWQ